MKSCSPRRCRMGAARPLATLKMAQQTVVVLLVLSVVLLGLLSLLSRSISVSENAENKLFLVKKTYVSAISQSQLELVRTVRQAAKDSNIAANKETPSPHGLEGSVAAGIRATFVDQLILWGDNCNKLAFASVQKALPRLCPSPDTINKLTWDFSGDSPALQFSLPITSLSHQQFILTGVVVLDANWIASMPSGLSHRKEFDLSLSKASKPSAVTLLELGPQIFLVSDARWMNTARSLAFTFRRLAGAVNDGIVLSVGLLLLLALGEVIRKSSRQKRALLEFGTQLTAQINERKETLDPTNRLSQMLHQHANVGAVEEFCQDLRSLTEMQMQKIRQDQAAILQLREELRISQNSQKEVGENLKNQTQTHLRRDSVLEQSRMLSAKILQSWTHLCSRMADLQMQVVPRLQSRAETLENWSKSWSEEVMVKGARKFIRSMSELEGTTPGISKLDEQISDVNLLATANSSEVASLAISMAQFQRDSGRLNFLLSDWHLVSGVQTDSCDPTISEGGNNTNWLACWQGLREDIALTLPSCILSREKQPSCKQDTLDSTSFISSPMDIILPAPKPILKSALMHLLRAYASHFSEKRFADNPQQDPPKIVARFSFRPTEAAERIVVTLERLGNGQKNQPPAAVRDSTLGRRAAVAIDPFSIGDSSQSFDSDLGLAKKLLSSFAISVQPLPVASQRSLSFALIWQTKTRPQTLSSEASQKNFEIPKTIQSVVADTSRTKQGAVAILNQLPQVIAVPLPS